MSQKLRSFPLIFDDGQRGELLTSSRFLDDSATRVVILPDGREMTVPREAITVAKDGTFRLEGTALNRTETSTERTVIPVVEEQLDIEKREVETGRIRVHKKVDTREIPVEEVLRTNDVDIQRVPVDRLITDPVEPRYEGETLVLPVLEEVLVVEKRLVLREEIRITRRVHERTERQTVPVRSEHIEVERVR